MLPLIFLGLTVLKTQSSQATGFDFKPICAALPDKSVGLSSKLFKSYKRDSLGQVKLLDNGYYVREFGGYYCVVSPEISALKYLKANAKLVKEILRKAAENGQPDGTCEINGADLDPTSQIVLMDLIETRLGVKISNEQVRNSKYTFGFSQLVSYTGSGTQTSFSPAVHLTEAEDKLFSNVKHNWSTIYDLDTSKVPFKLDPSNVKYFARPFSDYSVNYFNYPSETGDSGTMSTTLAETVGKSIRMERFELAKEIREASRKVAERLPTLFVDFFNATVSEDELREHKLAMEVDLMEKKKSPQEIAGILSKMIFSERNLSVELRTQVKFSNVKNVMGSVSVQIWP